MPFRNKTAAITLLVLAITLPLHAQERGSWHPASKTAQFITGDITFNGDRMTINFFTLPVAEIRPLKPAEISAAFDTVDPSPDAAGSGHLYRISIPADRRFLHKNTLCGSDETQWMATYVSGKSGRQLQIAFFSNAIPPVFTLEALHDSPNLCGIYAYVR